MKIKIYFKVIITILIIIYTNTNTQSYNYSEELYPKYISHAGGLIKGYTLTNCKEALDQSKRKGYKYIEVDISWTTDNMPVLLHSWDGLVTKFFGVKQQRYSYKEFKNFNMIEGFTQMTLHDLVLWMKENKEIYIITDVKENNIKLLELISINYPDIVDRIIPQIYLEEEYNIAKSLGYKNIIFTLYRIEAKEGWYKEFLEFIRLNNVYAVTMPESRVVQGIAKELNAEDVIVYCHTINNNERYEELKKLGVYGIYTDILY